MAGTLEDHDVDQLLAAVAELTAVRPVDQLRHDTVALLPSVIRNSLTAWNDLDLATGHMAVVIDEGRLWPDYARSWAAHVADHPVIAYYDRTNDGRPHAISDFLDEEAFHRTGIYQHVYRRLDAEDQLSFVLPHPTLIVGIAMNRERRGWSSRDRRIANLLRPFVVQAYRNAVGFERSRVLLEHVDLALAEGGEGVVVIDRKRRPVERTAGATRLLATWWPDAGTALPADLQEWLGASRTLEGRAWPLVVTRGNRRLLVRRLPGPSPSTEVLLLAEQYDDRLSAALRRVGLTARQAEVMAIVAEGATNADIGQRLGISHRTVDKHVQSAFSKLGVANRTAAANLVRQLEAPVGDDPDGAGEAVVGA